MDSEVSVKTKEHDIIRAWVAGLGNKRKNTVEVISSMQGWGKLGMNCSILNEPLCLAGKPYAWGFGTHADGEIVLRSSEPVKTFRSVVGVDYNNASVNGSAKNIFSVWANGVCVGQSKYLNVKSQPEFMSVDLGNVTEFTLKVNAENSTNFAHCDWAEAEITTAKGETIRLGMPEMSYCVNTLPISFIYNGMNSEQWLNKWGVTHKQSSEKDFTVHRFSCSDKETGLELSLELQEYKNLPACLWNVRFKNTSKTATPILEQIKTLDLNWSSHGQNKLYRARGAFNYANAKISGESFRDDFMLVTEELSCGTEFSMGGVGGRSSVDWMPYFNFEGKNEGLIFGVGWTGQWQAKIKARDYNIAFQAGMENICTVLNPGETISQPSTLMIYWQGREAIRGHNLLRHFILENLAPRDKSGNIIQAPACNLTWGGMVASSHLARIQNIAKEKIPLDHYWIDAGWYGNAGPNMDEFAPQWSSQTGNWSINHETFPHGFKEISDATHAIGKKFLLWVEPERAIQGTPITLEHPEWFLGEKKTGQKVLLDLGHPDAQQWCTELVAGLIATQGIDCYRQDFNIEPSSYWRANDTADRVGISEIRYIEGLYSFLSELRRRFPDLLIDNCASGGRRLDFEMMRYSIPLWGSDMQCFPDYITERNQQQVHGLSYWLPQFAFGTQDHAGDTYHFRSTIAAGVVIHLATYERCPIKPDYPYQWLRDRLNEYHRAKVFFRGDFYPLFEQTDSMKYWTAYQFNRADLNSGVLLFFRKSESDIEKIRFPLHALAAGEYELEDADTGMKILITGKELREKGLPVEITEKRGSRMFFYCKKK